MVKYIPLLKYDGMTLSTIVAAIPIIPILSLPISLIIHGSNKSSLFDSSITVNS